MHPNDDKLKREILKEAHTSPYVMHPGGTKMYQTIKEKALVKWYEKRYCGVHFKMFVLLTSNG